MPSYPLSFPNEENANVILNREGPVFWLTMTYECSKFNPTSVKALHDALDHVENMALKEEKGQPCALVTTGEKKYYSTGLDLQYLFQNSDPWFISDQYLGVLKRMLTFPVITVAAINGHAIAGGFLFALCHDFRIFNEELGWLSLNEIDLPSSLHPGMAALARVKLPPTSYRNMVFTGHRYTAAQALREALVDSICPLSALRNSAMTLANKYASKAAKAGIILQHLKQVSYEEILRNLDIRSPIDVRDFMKPKL